jgi:ABC-2 type transport system permease protein
VSAARPPSTLAAIAELRARAFWRRLAGRGGAEAVAFGVLFLVAIPGSLVLATLVGGSSARAARAGRGLEATLPVTAILFGVWQTWTALSLSLADRDALDLRRFLAFPVRPGRVYALGLATSVAADPFALFWLVVLAGAFVGAAVGRPGAWLAPLALVLAAFVAATCALVALLQELFARVARSRHFRAWVVLGALAGWAALVAGTAAWAHAPAQALAVLRRVQWLAFPPALASAAARHLYAGEVAAALPWAAALAASALGAGALAYRVALGTARAGGEGAGPARGAARPGLLARLAGPLLEKELRQLARHPVLRLYAIVLPILAGFAAWRAGAEGEPARELAAALPFLGLALYLHLVVQPFWLNAFGWERGGARLLFLAPLDLAAVLRAKNRATFAVTALLLVAGGSIALAAGPAPPPWALAGAAVLHAGTAPALHGIGNAVSILNPRAAAFGAQRGGALSALSSLAGMAIVATVAGVFALPVLAAVWLGQPWAMVLGWAALGAIAAAAYHATLPRAARLLARRRDALLAELCPPTG